MNIVVIGGTGLIGRRLVDRLEQRGHTVTPASPETGCDLLTGAGVAEAVAGKDVVVDVSNAPSFDDAEVMRFFTTATTTLLQAAATAGVSHHVVLSIVGCDRLPENGYLRAKHAQEGLVAVSGLPFTILRATQFFEFVTAIADASTRDGEVVVPTGPFRPMAADDVAAELGRVAEDGPAGGVREVGGPEVARMSDVVARVLTDHGDSRVVVADPHATYFGAAVDDGSLVPGPGAVIASTTYAEWSTSVARQRA